MPEITSPLDLTTLHLMKRIRASQLVITLAVRDPLPSHGERSKFPLRRKFVQT